MLMIARKTSSDETCIDNKVPLPSKEQVDCTLRRLCIQTHRMAGEELIRIHLAAQVPNLILCSKPWKYTALVI